jgi:hypothetical protein
MQSGPNADPAESYWRYLADRHSTDRATRLEALDREGPPARNYEELTERIHAGGEQAARTVALLAARAATAEQVAAVAAGPCEDLWMVDPEAFLEFLLPRLRPDLAARLVDGMVVDREAEAAILEKLRSL